MDEDRMTGRLCWSWLRYRIKEGRTAPLIEANRSENEDLPDVDADTYPSSIYERSWDSIPD